MEFKQDKPNEEARKALESIYLSKRERVNNINLCIPVLRIVDVLAGLTDSDLASVLSVIVKETKIKQAELEAEAKKLKVK